MAAGEVWERQRGESEKAFAAFVLYRDMEQPRSLPAVARQCNKSVSLINRWSSQRQWVERCRHYDNWIDAQARARRAKDIIAARARIAQQARAKAQTLMMIDVGVSRMIAKGVKIEDALSDMTPSALLKLAGDVARSFPNLAKTELLALGDVTERNEHAGPDGGPIGVDLTGLSDDDLAALEALLSKTKKKTADDEDA